MKLPDKIRLYVGKCDIKNGKPKQGDRCPIALAFKRKFNTWCHVFPSCGPAPNRVEGSGFRYNYCNLAKKFIDDFDHGRKVEPTKIILTKVK